MKNKTETKKQTKPEAKKADDKVTDEERISAAGILSAAGLFDDLLRVIISNNRHQDTPEDKPVDDRAKALADGLSVASAASKASGSPIKVRIVACPEKESDDLMDEDSPYSRLVERVQEKKAKELTPFDALYDMVSTDVETLNGTQIPELERIIIRLDGELSYDTHEAIRTYNEELRALRRAAEKLLAALDVEIEDEEKEEGGEKGREVEE